MIKQRPFNIKHFTLTENFRDVHPDSWKEYFECLKKKDKDGTDKANIKEFRKELKKSEVEILITHKPSRISKSFIVSKDQGMSLDRNLYILEVLKFVKAERTKLKPASLGGKDNIVTRTFDAAKIPTVGGVRLKPGLTNSFGPHLTINDPLKPKTPRMPNKHYIGIELEFTEKPNDLGTQGLAELFKKEGLSRYVFCTYDGSCGHEICVILEQDGFEEPLKKIVNLIQGQGYKVNQKCGTHVHLDMRRRDVRTAYNNLYMAQGLLKKFLSEERQKNRFCIPSIYSDFDVQMEHQKEREHLPEGRYFGLNVLSYKKHQTLEVRMHQGTLDAKALITWINVLIKIVDFKEKVEKEIHTFKDGRTTFKIEKTLWGNVLAQIDQVRKADRKKVIMVQDQLGGITATNPTPNALYGYNIVWTRG